MSLENMITSMIMQIWFQFHQQTHLYIEYYTRVFFSTIKFSEIIRYYEWNKPIY